jgi:hypothetical protein
VSPLLTSAIAGYEKKLNKKARFNTFMIFNKKLICFPPEIIF